MQPISNNIRKLVASLGNARHRREEGMFKAEGTKCVLDTIDHFRVKYLVATDRWLSNHSGIAGYHDFVVQATPRDMERMSSLSTAAEVIAVYEMPEHEFDPGSLKGKLTLALDCIQDPGNLGTIVRTADWFGIRDIICSQSTVDIFSPKTVQATMGAISRVAMHYCDLTVEIARLRQMGLPVYSTMLEGENIYSSQLTESGVILMGNEGRGVSEEVASLATKQLHIPSFPVGAQTSESLNVATATAIVVAEFRRRQALN